MNLVFAKMAKQHSPIKGSQQATTDAAQPHGSGLQWLGQHIAILAILIAFLLLGFYYSLVNPLLEASDELWHYPYVKHLADGNGLPVQQAGVDQPWRQEGSQPPLYYAISAAATFWVDTDDLPQLRWRNPHADMGIPKADRNINMIIHTERESLPTSGAALAIYIVRWLSVLMGAGTVLCTYLVTLELFPANKALAAGAAAFVAFNPMFLFISASVNNDTLANMLATLALWRTLRLVKGDRQPAHLVLLGLILGCAALAKASALGLFGLVGLALLIVTYREWDWRPLIQGGIIIFGLALLVSGWYFARNWMLYRDPLGLNMFVQIVGPRHPTPTLRQLWGERAGFTMSFWGFFGGMNVPMSPWVYRTLDILAGLGLLGFLISLACQWKRYEPLTRWQIGLVAIWPAVVFVSLIRWTLMTIATQGRLMFAAIGAIAILIVWGWLSIIPKRYKGWGAGIIAALFLTLAIAAPIAYIAPAYAQPPILTMDDLPADLVPLHVDFGGQMALLGYLPLTTQAKPGDAIPVTLYWRVLAPMTQDYSVFVHLLSDQDLIVGQRDMYPGQGTYPTTLWNTGDIIADTYVVPVLPATLTPTVAQVEVGLYDLQSGARLPVLDETGAPVSDNVRFGHIELVRNQQGEPIPGDIPNPVQFNLANQIALVGYELDRTAAQPGETFNLVLYWRALRDIEINYAVFTQIIDENANKWAQKDAWPQEGNAPTATWTAGQLIEDHYALVVNPDAPSGAYDLLVGMYGANDGKRLSLLGEAGQVQADYIILGKVRIVRP